MRYFVPLLLFLTAMPVTEAAPLVVETDPLSPDEQRAKFRLPEGFEIQLVASEPDIGQPMNLSFDAQGRLWVTHSLEYPYPVAGEGVEEREPRWGIPEQRPGRDRLTVLSDFQPDGRAAKVTHFVDELNIPIGQLPLGRKAIYFSIPDLHVATDDDGDGRADRTEVLYGRFGNLDTHGMVNSLTHWLDGWVYACHSFRNTSKVCGADGHCITMNSGNTFRFRPNGERVEQYSWGQVNPFGLTFSPWGDMFVADCHSQPITMILRGAYYSSFGKPHDGLGFGPDMIDHNHGSTGICGAAWMDGGAWPKAYHSSLFICNPVNGVVHHDQVAWTGSSPKAVTQPEFVTCEDGWFRPVDVQIGPDGALYIADFYNSIIGHYEVPLEHPQRDRSRGRIWRVVYTGNGEPAAKSPDLMAATLDELLDTFADPNLTRRTLATHQVVERFADEAADPLWEVLAEAQPDGELPRVHALWALERIEPLSDERLARVAEDPAAIVRTHLARLLAERPEFSDESRSLLWRLLEDDSPFVQRAAADAAGRHPEASQVERLLSVLHSTPEGDTHLRHMLRIALRDQLRVDEIAAGITVSDPSDGDIAALAAICLAVPTGEGARLLQELVSRRPETLDSRMVSHLLQYSRKDVLPDVIELVRQQADGDRARQREWLDSAFAGLQQRGVRRVEALHDWIMDVAGDLLDEALVPETRTWFAGEQPFGVQQRMTADGRPIAVWSSFPLGEPYTGVFRSEPFAAPRELSFGLAGHDGFPDAEAKGKNRVVLRSVADGREIASAAVPRSDTAQPVHWKLDNPGEEVVLELIDGDDGRAYAWLAAGEFSIEGFNPGRSTRLTEALNLIEQHRVVELVNRLEKAASDGEMSIGVRLQMCQTLNRLSSDAAGRVLLADLTHRLFTSAEADTIVAAVVHGDSERRQSLVDELFKTAVRSEQQRLAGVLAEDQDGLRLLLSLVERGLCSAAVFREAELMSRVRALDAGATAQVERWLERLPKTDSNITQEMEKLRVQLAANRGDAARGREVFRKSCMVCHRIGGEGENIGPQLDGVGGRGVDRILEDMLDPNRNVDAAFRMTTFLLTDGKVINGLVRREEGKTLVVADQKGKEITINIDEIDDRVESALSLMPANFTETLPLEDRVDLITYLQTQTARPAASGGESP